MDIGANPSAEEADEGVDSTSRKVVDIVDAFRLVVSHQRSVCYIIMLLLLSVSGQGAR